jgi:hypothetical protein
MKRYLTGVDAETEYVKAEAKAVYIISDSGDYGEVRGCQTGMKPSLAELVEQSGVIVFSDDFAWTVAAGPDYFDRVCFTYKEWVDDDEQLEEP